MFNRHFHTALFSAAMMLTAVPFAAGAAETRSVAVQSGDLNLATDAGRAALQQRVARAIYTVCGSAHGRTLEEVQAYATCSKAARDGAASQFDAMVAAAQSGRKVAAGANAAPSVQ